jgi:cytochrome c oxidase subunit 1
MFTVGLGAIANSVFAITTMLIAIPTGVKIFNWIGTLWGGSISFTTPMLFSVGFIMLFIIGGLSGVSHSQPPADYQQQDTYYIVAHLHYVLVGGSIFGLFSGIYYWFPKATGYMLNEALGKLNFWLMFIGMNLTFFPMHNVGLDGMPRRVYTYSSEMGWDLLNMLSTIGALIIALSVIVFVYNFFYSMRKKELSGSDPWDGRTLEWSISSPPPHYNFAEIPNVSGLDPFWEQKRQAQGDAINQEERHDIPMPSPSYFPIIVAFGVGLGALGFAYNIAFIVLGVLLTIIGVYGWSFEPAEVENHHEEEH